MVLVEWRTVDVESVVRGSTALSVLGLLISRMFLTVIWFLGKYGEFGAWAFILIVAVIGGFRAYVQNLVLRYNNALTLAAANILIQVVARVGVLLAWTAKYSYTPRVTLTDFDAFCSPGAYNYHFDLAVQYQHYH